MIHEQEIPAAQALQSKLERNVRKKNKKDRNYMNTSEESSISDESGQSSETQNISVKYQKKVTINRNFTYMARVTQPLSRFFEGIFSITHDTSNAFNITEIGGIVYISNASAIQNNLIKTHQ